jgi:hypothetical protein
MQVSTLTLALSKMNEFDIRSNGVARNHPHYYHVYYMKDGAQRVMLVPKNTNDMEKVQKEVMVLLQRNGEVQMRLGANDRVAS